MNIRHLLLSFWALLRAEQGVVVVWSQCVKSEAAGDEACRDLALAAQNSIYRQRISCPFFTSAVVFFFFYWKYF